MENKNLAQTKTHKAYCEFCIAKGIDVTNERILINTSLLLTRLKLKDDVVANAIYDMALDTRFFPDASAVKEYLSPDKEAMKDKALIMANHILDVSRNVSMYNKEEYFVEEYGAEAWEIVKQFGGVQMLTSMKIDQVTSFRAQLRELCGALARTKVREDGIFKPELLSSEKNIVLGYDHGHR